MIPITWLKEEENETRITQKIQVLSIQGQNSSSLIRIINGVGKFPTLELN